MGGEGERRKRERKGLPLSLPQLGTWPHHGATPARVPSGDSNANIGDILWFFDLRNCLYVNKYLSYAQASFSAS